MFQIGDLIYTQRHVLIPEKTEIQLLPLELRFLNVWKQSSNALRV